MEFITALINALISLSVSLYILKKFTSRLHIQNKILKVLTLTIIGTVIFELILCLLTTFVVVRCGGGICDMAYIALLFWLPFYIIITLITATFWVKKED